jgi:hypothetical protein
LLALNLLLPGTIGLWEGRLLSALGIGSDAKLMIGVLAVMLVLYWRLRRNKWSVATATREVPGWLAAIDMLVIVLGAGAVVWMASS